MTWGKDSIRQLVYDRQTGQCYYEVTQNPDYFYPESSSKAGRNAERLATPFIDTECARDLSATLDAAGLMFSPDFQANLISPNAINAMGSVYTEITRELAKGINRPERFKLSNLFVPFDNDSFGPAITEKLKRDAHKEVLPISSILREKRNNFEPDSADPQIEEEVRAKWKAVAHFSNSESANTLFTMIDELIDRDTAHPLASDLVVTNENVEFETGACVDVASFYIGAANNVVTQKSFFGRSTIKSTQLSHTREDNVSFLQKRLGNKDNYLSTEAVIFNGIHLPKGALFSRTEDGGWAFLRLTPFSFDKSEDQVAAAGSEIYDRLRREQELGKEVGGITISRFVELATSR